jgi:hypothetical protein
MTRLEGRPLAAVVGAILRDGASKSAVADFDTIIGAEVRQA